MRYSAIMVITIIHGCEFSVLGAECVVYRSEIECLVKRFVCCLYHTKHYTVKSC